LELTLYREMAMTFWLEQAEAAAAELPAAGPMSEGKSLRPR
jgi:hypothetical protein